MKAKKQYEFRLVFLIVVMMVVSNFGSVFLFVKNVSANPMPEVDTFYSTTSDGYIYVINADYDVARDASTGLVKDDLTYIYLGQFVDPYIYLYTINRAYLFFDTSSLPDDIQITSATLSLYGKAGASTPFYIIIQKGESPYPHDPLISQDYDRTHYSGNGGSFLATEFTTSGYNDISLTPDGRSWINKQGMTKFCLRSNKDIDDIPPLPGGFELVSFYSCEKGSNYRPKLTVEYSTSNNPPYTPSNPDPNDGETGVSRNTDLSWDGGDPDNGDTVTYKIYFGTNPDPPYCDTIGPYPWNQIRITWDPGQLNYNTHYYWKIRAIDNHQDSTWGPLWDFTTTSEPEDPILSYSPDEIHFGTHEQGWTGDDTFEIWNSGTGTLTYDISESLSWITVNPTSGSSTGEHDTITVNVVNTEGMLGYYSGNIDISSNGGNGDVFVDITLTERPDFYFIHLTDIHLTQSNAKDLWGAVLEEINNLDPLPAFVVATGDLADFGNAGGEFESPYLRLIDPFEGQPDKPKLEGSRITTSSGGWYITPYDIPIYFCPGNHDSYTFPPIPPLMNYVNYEFYIGDSYYHKSLSIGIHDIEIFSLNSGKDVDYPDTTPQGDGLKNEYGYEVSEFPIDIEASTADIKIVLTHHPYNMNGGDQEMVFINERDMFSEACFNNNVDLVCSGHTHSAIVLDLEGNWLANWDQDYLFTPSNHDPIQLTTHNIGETIDDGKPARFHRIGVFPNGDIIIYGEDDFDDIVEAPYYFTTAHSQLLLGHTKLSGY